MRNSNSFLEMSPKKPGAVRGPGRFRQKLMRTPARYVRPITS
jgi:hypothetical protein